MMNRSKRAMQTALSVLLPVAVMLAVAVSTLAQGPPRTEPLDHPPPVFLPFVVNNDGGSFGTSFEVIDRALARGAIDEETALVYKVFAVYLDPRLPERFKGDDSQVVDTLITAEVGARWSSLSPATQALLEPFLLPPSAPGSWLELQQEQAATAGPAEPIEWVTLSRPDGEVKVWYQARYPGDAALAAQILADVEDIVWEHLATLMGRGPLGDAGLPDNGGDDFFDIYVLPLGNDGEAQGYAPLCKNRPSFLLIDRATTNLRFTVVHEFMHAILWGYDFPAGVCEYPEYRWLDEATATWAADYISPWYDTGNAEHIKALQFLFTTHEPLETHSYGAYLWPFYLARSYQPGLIRRIWDVTSRKNSLGAIDEVIPEGFLEQWPEFAKLNLNREPVDQYKQWDGLTYAAGFSVCGPSSSDCEATLPDGGERKIPMLAAVPHLAARYYRFTFPDPKVSQVRYENAGRFFAGAEPRAHVEALIKIEGQGWTSEDWTRLPERKFCRTKPEERIQELVIIFSNSEWENRTHELNPGTPAPTLWYNDEPCSCEELSSVQNWTGQVEFSFTTSASSGDKTMTYLHSATVNLQMVPDYQNPSFIAWQDASLSGTGQVNDVYTHGDVVETLAGSGALNPNGPTQDDPSASWGVWLSTCRFEFHLQTGMPAQHTIRDPYSEDTFTVSTGVGFMDINDIPASQLTGSRTVPAVWDSTDEPSWFVPGSVLDSDLERMVGNNFGQATVNWSFAPAD